MRSRLLVGWLFMVLVAAPVWAQAGKACEMPDKTLTALRQVYSSESEKLLYRERFKQRLGQLDALRQAEPKNVWLHQQYQQLYKADDESDLDALFADYRARLSKSPNEPVLLVATASALRGYHTSEALTLLERAVQQDAQYAPAYHELAQVYQLANFRDRAKYRDAAQMLVKLCPQSPNAYRYLPEVEDPAVQRAAATALRALLTKELTLAQHEPFTTLWKLEFKTTAVAEHAKLREQVTQDLVRLRALNFTDGETWYSTLREGYQLVNDKAGKAWAEEARLNYQPNSSIAFLVYYNELDVQRLQQLLPAPTANDNQPAAKPTNRNALYYELSFVWEKRWPDNPAVQNLREIAAGNLRNSLPVEKLEAAALAYLQALERNPGELKIGGAMSLKYMLAQSLAMNGRLKTSSPFYARLPALFAEGLAETQQRETRFLKRDTFPPEYYKRYVTESRLAQWNSLTFMFQLFLQNKQMVEAREKLEQIRQYLAAQKLPDNATADDVRFAMGNQRAFLSYQADFALAENRKLDALAFKQNSFALTLQNSPADNDRQTDYQWQQIQKLWTELGGTEEGLAAWRKSANLPKGNVMLASYGEWAARDKRLPDFNFKDMQGKAWRLADLKGKKVFINVWATWCSPCLRELPLIQKLAEEFKNNPDYVVLTLSVDQELGLIEPFMKERQYTFPVIPARAYVEDLLGTVSIPRNWVLDATGKLVQEQLGSGIVIGRENEWLAKARRALLGQ